MSDWIGPNLYRIEYYKDRKAAIAVKDGTNVVVKCQLIHPMEGGLV